MAKKFVDKVRVATATTGQGTLTLGGAYDASFFSLAEAMTAAGAVDGDTTDYIIGEGDDFEIVQGGVIGASGTTITRGTTVRSKISGTTGTTKMTLTGAAQVRFYPTAESLNQMLSDITGNLSKSGGTLTGALTLAADAASSLQPVTLQQLQAATVNVGKRSRVRAATTANITISTALNNGDTLDNVTLATGDQVLVKNQSTAAQNGVYVVGVTPVRATEFDTFNEHSGSLIAVEEGDTNADTLWLCTSNDGGTLDTTAINFAAFTALSAASLGAAVHNATGKTTPDDADEFSIWDSVGLVLKKLTLVNLKAVLKTTAANIWAGTNDALFMTAKNAADSSAWITLTSSTAIATDASLGYNFFITLAHNTTLGAPTNLIDGRTYQWLIQQDATGSRTGAFNAIFEFAAPTLSTAAGKRDLIVGTYHAASGKIIASFRKGS